MSKQFLGEKTNRKENTFAVLSSMVKKNLVKTVQIPEIDQEIVELEEKIQLYEKAGFRALRNELEAQQYSLVRDLEEKKKIKQWRNKGYMVINLPGFEKYHRRRDFYSNTIVPNGFNPQEREVLAIIPITNYRGHVPEPVLKTLIDFKEENKADIENGFHILTYGVLKTIKEKVVDLGKNDPILLYKITETYSGKGHYAVVAWWGADLEQIEKALGYSSENYPNMEVV